MAFSNHAFLYTGLILLLTSFFFLIRGSVGQTIGRHIRRKSVSRRKLIVELIREELRASSDDTRDGSRGVGSTVVEGGEWEKIGDATTPAAVNGDQEQSGWNGVIGLFHPFWYVFSMLQVFTGKCPQ